MKNTLFATAAVIALALSAPAFASVHATDFSGRTGVVLADNGGSDVKVAREGGTDNTQFNEAREGGTDNTQFNEAREGGTDNTQFNEAREGGPDNRVADNGGSDKRVAEGGGGDASHVSHEVA